MVDWKVRSQDGGSLRGQRGADKEKMDDGVLRDVAASTGGRASRVDPGEIGL